MRLREVDEALGCMYSSMGGQGVGGNKEERCGAAMVLVAID